MTSKAASIALAGKSSVEKPFNPMTLPEYAALQTALGEQVVKVGDYYWRRVRPLFYRPLLPFQPPPTALPPRPWPAWLGGVQYPVLSRQPANSVMSFLISEPAHSYSLDALDYNRKRQVRLAARRFTARPITDFGEFSEKAYPVYLDFYERTRYRYKSKRQAHDRFMAWAQILFRFNQLRILGAWEAAQLTAVSISERVDGTVLYSTFFATTAAMKHHALDLMLHEVRQAAAATVGVRQVFAGMYKDGKGLDDSYLLRGFRVVALPAMIRANPVALALLRLLRPQAYAALRHEAGQAEDGDSPTAQGSGAGDAVVV